MTSTRCMCVRDQQLTRLVPDPLCPANHAGEKTCTCTISVPTWSGGRGDVVRHPSVTCQAHPHEEVP